MNKNNTTIFEKDEAYPINTFNSGRLPRSNVKINDEIRPLKTDITSNKNKQLDNSHMNTMLVTNDNKDEYPSAFQFVEDID